MNRVKIALIALLILANEAVIAQQAPILTGEPPAYLSAGYDLMNSPGNFVFQKQGNWAPSYISGFRRSGSGSVAVRLNPDSSGSQRAEYRIIRDKPISVSQNWYHGFSFRLEPGYPNPTSWHAIHQIQQPRVNNTYRDNHPFLALFINTEGMLDIRWASGEHGSNSPAPIPRRTFTHGIIDYENRPLRTGIWYDIIVGFKFSPYNDDGFVEVFIKKQGQTDYVKFGFYDEKVGYSHPNVHSISQSKVGIYKNADNKAHRLWIDDVRFSYSAWRVAHPDNTTFK